jgi:tetratricopeptide (TPR) repeat protein
MRMDERLDQSELDALWNFDDPIASADRFAQAAAEPDRSEVVRAELETQRARALGLQQRFDEADALLDSLEPAIGQLAIRIPLERGRLRNSAGRSAEAIPLFEEALANARRDGDVFLAVDAAHMLAIADAERSAGWTREGLAELENTRDRRTWRWAISLYNNRGWRLFDDGMPVSALEEFAKALTVAREDGTDDQLFWAEWTLARCLREVGRTGEALAIQTELVRKRPEDPRVLEEVAALTVEAHTIEP